MAKPRHLIDFDVWYQRFCVRMAFRFRTEEDPCEASDVPLMGFTKESMRGEFERQMSPVETADDLVTWQRQMALVMFGPAKNKAKNPAD
jgi:hypothetical protein